MTLSFSSPRLAGLLGLLCTLAAGVACAGVLKAEYLFDNTFTSTLAGAPALSAVDPNATNVFLTDTVFSQSRSVYATNGTASSQAGLTLDTTGLISPTDYSVEMVLGVSGGYGAYMRLLQTGTNDNGLYIDLNGKLNTYASGSNPGLAFSLNTYHHLVVTVSGGGLTQVWLDGALSHTLSTSVLNITAPGDILSFFIDELAEFTNARTALIRLWDAPLTASEVGALASDPLPSRVVSVPEPITLTLFATGLCLMGWTMRRRQYGCAA